MSLNKLTKLAIVPLFIGAASISSCGKGGGGSDKYVGTHIYTATPTDKDFVVNHQCDYTLVMPTDPSSTIRTARDEFNYFFEYGTGTTLPYIEDSGLVHSASQKYISLGRTHLLESANLNVNYKELTNDGIRIITKDSNIYIVGGTDWGTLYGVYDFMKIVFNYQQYAADYFEMDSNVANLKLLNFDVKDIPDIPLRATDWGYYLTPSSTDYDYRMFATRLAINKGRGQYFMPVFKKLDDYTSESKTSTNTNTYVPYEDWYGEHPKWFSNNCETNKYQLCYTCHGDHNEWEALADYVAKKVEMSLKKFTPTSDPEKNVITFTMEDNFNTCTCDACMAAEDKYGAQSGALNVFVNRVGEKVEEWMKDPANAEYKRDDFHIIFFAYNAFEKPPVKKSGNSFVPTYEECRLRNNVGVYFAEINNCDFQSDFFGEINKDGKEMFDGWRDIADFVYYWVYATNYAYYMYPYDSFSCFNQKFYNYVASKHIDMIFPEGQASCGSTGTTWNALRGYLDARLSWDSSLDEDQLVDDYFRAMFQGGKDAMMNAFLAFRAQNEALLEAHPELRCIRSNYNQVKSREYYDLATLESLVKMVDNAKKKVESLKKTDLELYEKVINHMEAEAVTPLFIILDLYRDDITAALRYEIIDRLYLDNTLLHLDGKKIKESGAEFLDTVKSYDDR